MGIDRPETRFIDVRFQNGRQTKCAYTAWNASQTMQHCSQSSKTDTGSMERTSNIERVHL